jgi:hypothetical protein
MFKVLFTLLIKKRLAAFLWKDFSCVKGSDTVFVLKIYVILQIICRRIGTETNNSKAFEFYERATVKDHK